MIIKTNHIIKILACSIALSVFQISESMQEQLISEKTAPIHNSHPNMFFLVAYDAHDTGTEDHTGFLVKVVSRASMELYSALTLIEEKKPSSEVKKMKSYLLKMLSIGAVPQEAIHAIISSDENSESEQELAEKSLLSIQEQLGLLFRMNHRKNPAEELEGEKTAAIEAAKSALTEHKGDKKACLMELIYESSLSEDKDLKRIMPNTLTEFDLIYQFTEKGKDSTLQLLEALGL